MKKNPKNILFIANNSNDHLLFHEAVQEIDASAKCQMVKNGADAILWLAYQQPLTPDVIFMEWNLPGLSGKELIFRIRAFPHLKNVGIVIYTNSFCMPGKDEVMQLGNISFVPKPSQFEIMCSTVNDIISYKRDNNSISFMKVSNN